MATPDQTPVPREHIPYTITSQSKEENLTPDGRFVKVWRVSFIAPNGSHLFIEVPENEYNAANVDALIEAELDTVMAVHDLGEQPHPENAAE